MVQVRQKKAPAVGVLAGVTSVMALARMAQGRHRGLPPGLDLDRYQSVTWNTSGLAFAKASRAARSASTSLGSLSPKRAK